MTIPLPKPTDDDVAAQRASWGWIRFAVTAATLWGGSTAVHGLAAERLGGADTVWFAATGLMFVIVTAVAHRLTVRGQGGDPVVAILGSMAIRVAGTFAILGALLIFSPLERSEAVFNVLFWYITLTAWDVWILVRGRIEAAGALAAAGRGPVASPPDSPGIPSV